jgi:hypothetical protein
MTHLPPQPNNDTPDDVLLLSAYIDDELTASERATLEDRLNDDPALRRELEELRTTTALLRDMPTVTPPRSFALDAEQVRPRRSLLASPFFTGTMGVLRFGGLAAALVVAVTVTTLIYLGQADGETAQVADAPPVPESAAPDGMGGGAPEAGMLRQGETAPPAAADTPAEAEEVAPMLGEAAPTAPAAAAEAAPSPPPEEQAATILEEDAAAADEAAESEAETEAEAAPAADEPPAATPPPIGPTPLGTPTLDAPAVATQEAADLADEVETSVVDQENAASTTQDLAEPQIEPEAEPAPAPVPLIVLVGLALVALLGGGWWLWRRQRR